MNQGFYLLQLQNVEGKFDLNQGSENLIFLFLYKSHKMSLQYIVNKMEDDHTIPFMEGNTGCGARGDAVGIDCFEDDDDDDNDE